MAKKKKDPLAAAARQVVKDTANKAVKQTAKPNVKKQPPKQSSRQNVRQNAKNVSNIARNTMRNAGESTKRATVSTAKALPKKKAKPFKASDLSGNTGRGVTKQARKQTKSAYTGASQRKAQAKQKEKDIRAGKFNVPNRLSQADEMMLSKEGKNQVNYWKDQWEKAKARGDKAGMQKAHEEAEKVRLTNPATVKTTTYEGPTQSQVTMAALQQYAQAMQAGDEEGMKQAKNLAAYAMLNVPKDNREQSYMTGAYSGGTWGDRYLEASESDILKNQKKNLLKSEGAAFASAVPEAAGGYIETVMNAPDIKGGSSQLVVKDQNVDKRTASQFDLRGQSRYTEEDARAKADHYQAQAEYLKQIAYATTPLPGVVGKFAVDATAAAGGMGIDLAANTVIPGAGLVSMGARTFGSSVQQAKDYQKVNGTDNDPYADAKAYLYGAAIAGTEIASEKMFGGPFQKIYGRGFADAAVKGATKPTIGKTILKGLLEEGSEEVAADLAQWQAPRIYGGETETIPEMLRGAAYDFTLGAALGGLGGAVTAPGQVRAEKVQNLRKRMQAVGYAKDDIDTAFQRMTVGDMEELTDSPDSALEAWVDTVIGRTNKTSQIENQSLAEASGEQSSEQTFEEAQTTVSRGKAWDALRSRLRESGIRDSQMLKTIRDRMSVEEMQEAANLRKNDFLEWRDRVTSPDYQPAPREEEEPTENITAAEEPVEGELVEEEEQAGTDSNMVKAIAEKLMSTGVAGPEMTKAIAPFLRENNATEAERVLSMSEDEVKAWARGEEPKPAEEPTPKIKQEDLRQQTEMIAEMAKAESAPQQQAEDITPVSAISNTLGKAGKATMNGMYNDKQNPVMYSREMIRAYNAGFSGIRLERIGNKTITQIQANAMYRAGATDRQSSLIAQKQNVRNAIIHDKKTAGLLQDEYVEKNVDDKKAKSIDRIAKALGVKVFFADSVGGMDPETKQSIANGSYQGGTVLIAKDSDESINFVYGHEITHRMKEISPDAYEKLKKFVMEQPESAREVEKTMSVYASYNIPITDEAAIEEVVADYVGMVIDNQDLLEDFARRVDRNVLQRFLDALKAIVGKLTGKEKTDMQEAIKTIENALDTSVKASRKLQKNATAADVLNSRSVLDSETGEKYSLKSMAHDLRNTTMIDDIVTAGIMSREDANDLRKNIEKLMEFMTPLSDVVDLNETYTKNNRPYAPIKPNSDPLYKVSLDFTTMCRKRLLTQSIIERIQVAEKKATSAERKLKIREMLQKYREIDNAVQVACGMCYVEAARYKSTKPVNAWLKNPTPIVTKYFAKKDTAFEEWVKKEAADFKESKGYARDATKKDMSNADVNMLNKQNDENRRKYKLNAEQRAVLEKIKKLPPETFLTEKNLTKLLIEEPVIYDIFISNVRMATRSKAEQGPVPYYYGDSTIDLKDSMIQKMNAENGLRFSSWSDWQVQHMLDLTTAVIDLSIRGVKMHGYTKFPEIVRIFGKTGMQFNLSGVLGTVEPIINEDGTYSMDNFDSVEGVDIKEAIETRNKFPETAGIQCIGVSDAQIKALLKTDWVDYIIPYHASGLNKALRKIAKIEEWKDYTKVQEAHPIDKKAEPGPGQDAENWHKEPVFSEFMVWEGKDGLDCMRKSAQRYIKLCEERGMTPKFDSLKTEDNYWKLLIDRKMINQETKELIEQQPVKPIFDFDEMKKAVEREAASYNPNRENAAFKYVVEHGSEAGLRFDKKLKEEAGAIKNEFVANVVNPTGKFSLKKTQRDADYLDAVERGDMETVERLVREAAAEAGYPTHLFHGTNRFGWTKPDTKYSDDGISFFASTSEETAGSYTGEKNVRRVGSTKGKRKSAGRYMYKDLRFDSEEDLEEFRKAFPTYTPQAEIDEIEDEIDSYDSDEYDRIDDLRREFLDAMDAYRKYDWSHSRPTSFREFRDNPDKYGVFDVERAVLAWDQNMGLFDFFEDPYGTPVEDLISDMFYGFEEYASEEDNDWTFDKILDITFPGRVPEGESFQEKAQGVYDLFANTNNMEEIDGHGAHWNGIMYRGKQMSTRDISRIVRDEGKRDGVIIRNIYDTAGSKALPASDIYIFHNPARQVKSADPITYDDEGNIIPLSERFNPDKSDIRWSLRGGRTSEELAEAYGVIPPGEKRAREVRVPRQTADEDMVSKSIRTVMEAQLTPEELLPTLDDMIANGEFSYNPITDKAALSKARATLKEKGFLDAYAEWKNDVDEGKVSKDIVTLGWVLYDQSLKDGDVDTTLNILTKMSRTLRIAGQAVQATRILKTLPTEVQMRMIPQPRPKHVQKKIDEYEEEEDDDEFDPLAPDEYDEDTGLPKPKPKKPRKPREKKKPTQDEVDQMEIDTAEEQAKRAKSTFMEKWNAWRYLAMLFNLRTHDRNIIGNLGFAPIVMSKNLTATVVEIALYNTVGKSHGMRRTKSFYGLNLFHYAWNDFLEMRPVIMGDAKYEGQERDDEKVIFRGILAPVEKARKLNSALLDMEDAWFSRPQYANALAQFMAANGITVEMMETGVGRIEKGPHKGEEFNGGILQEARAYAVKEAQKATYRDLNDVSQFFMRIGKPRSDNNKVEKFGHMLIEGIIPFRKTPANILCRAMEYSPAGFAKGMYDLVFGVPRGKKTVAEALDMLCSGFSGTAIFVLGMYLAKMGLLVAKTDDGDDEQKYFSQLLGHQQWALEINGYSVTIDWLAPEVVPLFMGAQYFTSQTSGNPIRNISNMLDSASMVIDPVLELSCLSGVQETLDNAAKFAEGDLNTMTGLIATMGLSYMSQGIPTLFGQLERVSQEERMRTFTTDDPERALSADWQYQIGKISAKIPGWDYHQIPYVDSWGNTETETNLWKRIVSNMVSPAYFKKIDDRAVNKELQRLYDATGDGRVLPDPGWKTYTYKDENGKNQTYFLTEEEYLAYGRAKGRNNFDLVQKFIKSPAYQKVSDADKAEIIDDLYYYGEYKASSEYIHNYRKEPYSWVDNYNNFSNQVGGYDVADFIIVRNATQDVKGLKDPKHPDKNAISGTSACSKVLAIYNSGASVPTDPEKHEAFMEALDVAKTYRGYNKAQAEEFLNKTRKKYGITD